MDMMHLAIEDAMFVEESYASCHAVVKMPVASQTINQLKALINLSQSSQATDLLPNWLSKTLLCQETIATVKPSKAAFSVYEDRIVWMEH